MFLTPLFTSDRLERVLHQLSNSITSALNTTHLQHKFILNVLRALTRLENHSAWLTEVARGWCSVICENRQCFEDWKSLLLLSLEVGFRHLDPRDRWIWLVLTHTEHHQELVGAVFESGQSEAIADLLHAWTVSDDSGQRADALLGLCAGHLVDLHSPAPLSPRLRRLIIRSIGQVGYKGFEGVEAKKFIEFLSCLHVRMEDIDCRSKWASLFLDIIHFSGGVQHLSDRSWELLVELIVSGCGITYPMLNPQVMTSLLDAKEWEKLEC